MALDGAGCSSQFVQLDVAQFMDDETGSLAEDHRVFLGFLRSSRIDFVYEFFLISNSNEQRRHQFQFQLDHNDVPIS